MNPKTTERSHLVTPPSVWGHFGGGTSQTLSLTLLLSDSAMSSDGQGALGENGKQSPLPWVHGFAFRCASSRLSEGIQMDLSKGFG